MIAVITGDVVKSRSSKPEIWLPVLQDALEAYSDKYDIFRGDSFQAEISPEKVFEAIFYIKSSLIAIQLDARIGIGIGQEDMRSTHVKNSFGTALLYSGEAFDKLGKETASLRSSNVEFDALCNTILPLLTELSVRWTPNIAATVQGAILHKGINQIELAKILGKRYQSQVSTELQKAGFLKMQRAIDYCTKSIATI